MVKIFTTKYQFLGRILLTLLFAVVSCVNAWAEDKTVSSEETYTGTYTVNVGETLKITSTGVFKITGNLINNGGTIIVDGGTLEVGGKLDNNVAAFGETDKVWNTDGKSKIKYYKDADCTEGEKDNENGRSYRKVTQPVKAKTEQSLSTGKITITNGSLMVNGTITNLGEFSIVTNNENSISRASVGENFVNGSSSVYVETYNYTGNAVRKQKKEGSSWPKEDSGEPKYENEKRTKGNLKAKEFSGILNLDNGYLVVNGDATLENGSQVNYKQTNKNLKGVVGEEEVDIKSTVIVKGNLTQNENAKISNENSSKADLIIGGMYYDLAPKENHPWSIEYKTEKFIVKYVTGAEFEMSDDNFTLNVGGGYSVTTESVSSDGFISAIIKIIFGGTLISPDAKDKIKEYLKDLASNGIGAADVSNIIEKVSTLLPITLNYFTAEQDGEDVVFEWQTSSEVNNDFFTIEYSIDGIHFKELLREDGNGTTSVTNDYYATATVENFADITYFRLKQTDFNGEYSYPDVIFVSIVSEETELYVFPNPTTDYVTVSGNVASAYVSDMYGRNMSCLQTSENTFAVAGLSVGTYYVVVSTKNGKKVLPFVKK